MTLGEVTPDCLEGCVLSGLLRRLRRSCSRDTKHARALTISCEHHLLTRWSSPLTQGSPDTDSEQPV